MWSNPAGNEARLGFQSGADTTNAAIIGKIQYNFPVGDRIKLTVGTCSVFGLIDVLDDLVNPFVKEERREFLEGA